MATAIAGNFNEGRVRTCDTTGLSVCLTAEFFIKANAVLAVVCLLVGALLGVSLAFTRWVQVLSAGWYYKALTMHGITMLIFWILFFEMAVLYFAGTSPLNSRLFSPLLAWAQFLLMVIGAVMVEYTVLVGPSMGANSSVLMTSYPPLQAQPNFYLGLILHAVGALLGTINFLGCVYIARRDKTYEGTMPLVSFGALAAAIIAVYTLLHGAIALVPTWFWSLGWMSGIEPGWYRVTWWALGHPAQQVNLCAMVAIWYFMGTMTTGARPLNEAVSRSAFVLYILFINLASAHHLLVDPGLGAGWKIWNTSYAMYLAVLASLIHGFTVPASIEGAMRTRGYDQGAFGWLKALPWRDPGFSAVMLSLIIFGFLGGITGVTLGTEQINIIAHNTLRIPGHFHATVVGGTTLAFMGLTYYVVPLIFRREYYLKSLCRIQPYLFAVGVTTMSVAMSFAGSYGVPRRHWDATFSNAAFQPDFSAANIWLALIGVGGVILFLAVLLFILLTVAAVFFGKSNAGEPMASWQGAAEAKEVKEHIAHALREDDSHVKTPGTMITVIVFLLVFMVYYFANWKALTVVWPVR